MTRRSHGRVLPGDWHTGYEILWRATTSPEWEHAEKVGNVTRATLKLSKDNVIFAVRAVDAAGARKLAGCAACRSAREATPIAQPDTMMLVDLSFPAVALRPNRADESRTYDLVEPAPVHALGETADSDLRWDLPVDGSP